jgi:hypothetical protein
VDPISRRCARAQAIKAMIMQAQLLRGNALSVMQEEIKSVVSRATHEREAKRHRCAQDAPEPTAAMHCARACDQAPLSLFLATPITAEDDCCWDLDDTGRSTPSASAKIHGTNPQKTEKEELDKRSFVDEIFAHSCLSCGWPIAHCQTQGTCRVGNGKDHA